jgi:hypothetical protein
MLMKHWIMITMLVLLGCSGSLSDEQRKRMHEQMDLHKIKRVTENEINEAAFSKGREIIKLLETFQGDSTRRDSLIKTEKGKIRWIVPGASNARELEQQLMDAYINAASGSLQDNVQKIRNAEGESDSLLYTKPVVSKMANGADKLEGVWNIWLSKKQLILAMDKK